MMSQSVRLGKIWGIPIGINASWFIVFMLLTLSLVTHFAELHPHSSPSYYYTISVLTSLLFFASVLLHELGHSAVALRKGIPIRNITLFVFGGVAQLGKFLLLVCQICKNNSNHMTLVQCRTEIPGGTGLWPVRAARMAAPPRAALPVGCTNVLWSDLVQ